MYRFFIIIFILFLSATLHSGKTFKIVYKVRPDFICKQEPPFSELSDSDGRTWFERIKTDFHATGVCLIIPWSIYDDPSNLNAYSTRQLISVLNLVQKYQLDLYISVYFSSIPGFLEKELPTDYFQINYNQKVAQIPDHTPLLNFAHPKAVELMLKYYTKILTLLKDYPNVQEVIPTFTWDAETEYPHQFYTSYSKPMQMAFQKYLKNLYKEDIQSLNEKWSKGNLIQPYIYFEDIVPNPSWGDNSNFYINFNVYNNSFGKIDWLNFRTDVLMHTIEVFLEKNKEFGYRMPLQIGCTFDSRIERRGWLDFTPLLENVNGIRVADIASREESFEFHANLIRSLIDFWKWQDPNKHYFFSTETNWPGYKDYSPDMLSKIWIHQLKSFYKQGADAHFIYGWFSEDNPDLLKETYLPYKAWIDTLGLYKNKPLQNPSLRKEAVFYSTARNAVIHGYNHQTKSEIENYESLKPYDKDFQIVTDYMILNNLEYINNFDKIYFTANSHILSNQVLKQLMQQSIKPNFVVMTFDEQLKKYVDVPGFLDETGKRRQDYKINFIWRSRNDLQRLFPSGNKCDSIEAQKAGWSIHKDFIDWCVEYGNKDYKDLNITYQNWHSLAMQIWENNYEVQKKFPDGYHSLQKSTQTLLDYILEKSVKCDSKKLKILKNWPYYSKNNY